MATVAIKILKHRKKMDGTYNVNIRIKHKNGACYLPTYHFVCDEQLSPDLTLKDPFVYNQLHNKVQRYRAAIGKLGNTLDFHSASDLKEYLLHLDRDVDFIKFSTEYIDNLLNAGRKGSAHTLKTVVYSLINYFKQLCVRVVIIPFFLFVLPV